MKTIRFIIIGWRDSAYTSISCCGYGEYNVSRKMEMQIESDKVEEFIKSTINNGCVKVNGKSICVDWDGPACISGEYASIANKASSNKLFVTEKWSGDTTFHNCILMLNSSIN